MIDTGDERSVTGHFISGTVFSAIFAGAMNYNKYKNEELSKDEMIQDTGRLALQGGIGTASAVATANYVGNGNYLGALTAISLGAMGIYGVQKASEMIEEKADEAEKVKVIEEK